MLEKAIATEQAAGAFCQGRPPRAYLTNVIASGYFQTSPLFALIAATSGKITPTTPGAISNGMPKFTIDRTTQTTA